MKRFIRIAGLLLSASVAFSQVTVTSPANNSTVGSPAQFVAHANSTTGRPITAMHIYVDNQSHYFTTNSSINTSLNLSGGKHYVVVQAWDASGKVYMSPLNINVGGGGTGTNVVVTSPGNNATVGSPTQFVASATSSSGGSITAMRIYVDNNSNYFTGNSSLNTSLNLSSGKHSVVVQAWDSKGQIYKTPLNITVSGGGGIPSNAGLFDNIDQMNAWQNCDVCAGPGGQGSTVPHSLSLYRSSPSMDGQSAQFWLGGTRPYSAALWWRQLGAQSFATHFVYDLYFYANNPGAPQALEFDVNQSVGGHKYIFGTECNYKGTHQWDVWDGAHWAPTGVGCSQPSANTWHHLVWEFNRTSDNKVQFVSVTLDGKKSYINRSYSSIGSGVQELNVAFQEDGDYREENYSIWLDKIKLYYW